MRLCVEVASLCLLHWHQFYGFAGVVRDPQVQNRSPDPFWMMHPEKAHESQADLEAVSAVSTAVPSVSNQESLKEYSHNGGCYHGKIRELIGESLQSFACPWSLLAPVVMATLTQITQWSIVPTIGEIGAEMCDAESCSGKSGRFVFRISLTLSQILVPLGSIISSLVTCPSFIFYILCLLQYLSCFVICAATAGVWRSLWTSEARTSPLHFLICTVRNVGGLCHHHGLQIHRGCRVNTTCEKTQRRSAAQHSHCDSCVFLCRPFGCSCQ